MAAAMGRAALRNLGRIFLDQRPRLLLDIVKICRVAWTVVLWITHARERLWIAARVAPDDQAVGPKIVGSNEIGDSVRASQQRRAIVICSHQQSGLH